VKTIRLATRSSALALWQANRVATLITNQFADVNVQILPMTTSPDRRSETPLSELGGDKGLFVKEVEDAILAGEADAAVHSLKDVPVDVTVPGLELVAMPERADPRDVLFSAGRQNLMSLPPGARVATSSARRAAHVLHRRKDLRIVPVRGNVDTRLRKLGENQFDALILAAAGVSRLKIEGPVAELFPVRDWCPAAGQGIMVVESLTDSPFAEIWQAINSPIVQKAAIAERMVVDRLGANCHSAAGAYVWMDSGDRVGMSAFAASQDGQQYLTAERVSISPDYAKLAEAVANDLLARGAANFIRE
jgi:hydroxymethylbilane synthase